MVMPAASVVLVEDSVPYARLVELILADLVPGGVEVRHHDTVRDARADLRERGADCILLDFGLPDANGLEALTLVLEVSGGAPVIVLSGHDDMELATAAIRAGAQDYLVKGQERPSALFLRAIRFAIERRRYQERNEDLLRATLALVEQELRRHQGDVLAVAALAREAAVADAPVAMLLEGARGVLGAETVELLGADPPAAASGETVVDRPVLRGDAVLGTLRVHWPAAVGAPGEGPLSVVELLAAELGAVLEQQRLLERLRELARTDPLTGLANRRLWDERVAVEIVRAQRYERPLCVAAIDLDRFKPYNDAYGHQAGDVLLCEATAAWQGVLRGADLLSRWGGDEFALLLPDCDLDCAERIVSRLQEVTSGSEDDVGCSVGLVCWELGESAEQVVARADAALYAAKADGRGGIRVA
jgi:diguanylate cyclase (GGDEF)-like protein